MTARDYDVKFTWGPSEISDSVTDSPIKLMGWQPTSPRVAFEVEKSSGHGSRMRRARRRHVTERMDIEIQEADMATNFATLEVLKRLFEIAGEVHEDDSLYIPRIQMKNSAAGSYYFDELYGGRIIEHPETMGIRWERDRLRVMIEITRRGYWEHTTASLLELTNQHGTDQTALAVYNHSDPAHDNFVKIDAADIPGDLPSMAEIYLTNGTGAAIRRIYIAMYGKGLPFTFVHTLEAEDAALEAESTSQAAATASDGNYVESIWATDVEELLFTWTLDSTIIERSWGKWFKMLTRFHTAPATPPKVRLKLLVGSDVLWEGEQVQLDATDQLQDLGEIKLPPYVDPGGGDTPDMKLEFYGQVAGGTTLHTDVMQLFCKDGLRIYEAVAGGMANAGVLQDLALYDRVVEDSSGRIPRFVATGDPILLRPNIDHTLYVLWDKPDGSHVIDDSCTLSVRLAPRRASF